MSSRIKALYCIGCIIVIMPFIGIFTAIKAYILSVLGLSIIILTHGIRMALLPVKEHPDSVHHEQSPESSTENVVK